MEKNRAGDKDEAPPVTSAAAVYPVGVAWYFYEQVRSDSGDGGPAGDLQGQAFGAGPAVRYVVPLPSRNLVLTAKWLHEFHTRNRFEGDYLYACVALRF